MSFKLYIMEKKFAVIRAWYDAALVVPAGVKTDFREKQRALVVEAMGYNLEEGMGGLFDALLQGVIPDNVSRFLDSMIRTRAASDFTASQAVAFILEIKKIVRKELGSEILADLDMGGELSAWDSVVDDLILHAFNIYAQCREIVLAAKADDEKQETLRLLKKAKLIPDDD